MNSGSPILAAKVAQGMRAAGDLQNKIAGDESITDGQCGCRGRRSPCSRRTYRAQSPPEFLCPPVERQRTLEIDGLVNATMVFAVADGVADKPFRIDQARCRPRDACRCRSCSSCRVAARAADADGEDFHRATLPTCFRFCTYGLITAHWQSESPAPKSKNSIQLLAKVPGLGPRSARRAALHLIKKKDQLLGPLVECDGRGL